LFPSIYCWQDKAVEAVEDWARRDRKNYGANVDAAFQ